MSQRNERPDSEPDRIRFGRRLEHAIFDPPPRAGWRKKTQSGLALLCVLFILQCVILVGHGAYRIEAWVVHRLITFITHRS